ncbi:hypothetical protein TNCV_3051271 [Trichonephila clavipes]|nr:hypothetical protein TNCV_3051271 [Trichonephila clavipes]
MRRLDNVVNKCFNNDRYQRPRSANCRNRAGSKNDCQRSCQSTGFVISYLPCGQHTYVLHNTPHTGIYARANRCAAYHSRLCTLMSDCSSVFLDLSRIALIPLRHEGTLNSRRAASPLARLVNGEERWEASDHLLGVPPQN